MYVKNNTNDNTYNKFSLSCLSYNYLYIKISSKNIFKSGAPLYDSIDCLIYINTD